MEARSATLAAWVAAIAAIVAVPLAVASLVYTIWTERAANEEDLVVSVTRAFNDYATQLQAWTSTTGTVSVYWDVLVSNNGRQDVSLVGYELLQVSDATVHSTYTDMDQGLYSSSLGPADLPVVIPAGNSKRFYLRAGLLMDPVAYRMAKDAFPEGSVDSVVGLTNYLYSRGMDSYGNAVESPVPGMFTVPAEGRREQTFLVTLSTARGTRVSDIVSWYAYSGLGE